MHLPQNIRVGGSHPWRRTIIEDEAVGAAAAFIMAHPNCASAVDIERVDWLLVCWCEYCRDIRTYLIRWLV